MLDDLLLIAIAFLGGSAGFYAVTFGHGVLGLAFALIGLGVLFALRLIWFLEDNVGAYPWASVADLYPVLERWVSEAADG